MPTALPGLSGLLFVVLLMLELAGVINIFHGLAVHALFTESLCGVTHRPPATIKRTVHLRKHPAVRHHSQVLTMSSVNVRFRAVLLATGLIAGGGLGVNAIAADNAAPTAHSDGVGAALGDTAITAKVKASLMGESGLKDSDISVTTTNGVVTLKGAASNADARKKAGELAIAVEGVKSVDNGLVTPSATRTEAKTKKAMANTKRVASDSWITTKVKSVLLADSVSKGFEVNVDTVNGVVVLKGTLANQDAIDHVKDIAAKVEGVKSVDTSALVVSGK